jgi:hypothetical protein
MKGNTAMDTVQVQAKLTFEQLVEAVRQLPRHKQKELARRIGEWQSNIVTAHKRNGAATQTRKSTGRTSSAEAQLIEQTKADLPEQEKRRLKKLCAKSERGVLTASELAEYQELARRAEQIDVLRVKALAELARLRGQPLPAVMKDIGWKSANDET